MKRFASIALILILLLSGCAQRADRWIEPVTFYYLLDYTDPDNRETFFAEGAIGSEIREGTGHRNDLYYLISMYLRGPTDPKLVLSFPAGCKVADIHQNGQELTVCISNIPSQTGDMELTVAGACLAKTCMDLTGVPTVHLEFSGQDQEPVLSRSYSADTLLLEDLHPQPTEPTA